MVLKYYLIAIIILTGSRVIAQNEEYYFVDKWLLIIASTNSIETANSIAHTAAEKTKLIFKDSKLQVDTNAFANVTFPIDSCKLYGFEYPCYVPRGRWDDGNYLTIESSNGYKGFTTDLFIVVAASGRKQDIKIKDSYENVIKHFPDSYFKRTKMYMGCLH